jgi:hypothetical protein
VEQFEGPADDGDLLPRGRLVGAHEADGHLRTKGDMGKGRESSSPTQPVCVGGGEGKGGGRGQGGGERGDRVVSSLMAGREPGKRQVLSPERGRGGGPRSQGRCARRSPTPRS